MMKAKDIMSTDVITIEETASIEDVARLFVEKHISGVPVVNADGILTGIVTEGDLIHQKATPRAPGVLSILGAFIYFQGVNEYREDFAKLIAMNVHDVMSKKVITIDEEMSVHEIADIFVKKDINRAPVMKDGQLIGIVSREDIIRSLLMPDDEA